MYRGSPACHGRSIRPLRADQRGLSTLEYAILFCIIIVAGLVVWSTLGTRFSSRTTAGTTRLSCVFAAILGAEPPTGCTEQSPILGANPSTFSSSSSGAARSGAAPNPRAGLPTTVPSVADGASAIETSPSSSPAPTSSAAPQGAASTTSTAADAHGLGRKLGTGGKVAVVAGGAVLGAATAAGTTWAVAYGSSLACGPGAPACAGAVTLALAGAGVYALTHGGWQELKGAFGAVFSREDATVGQALTVGTTLGGVAYGVGEAAMAARAARLRPPKLPGADPPPPQAATSSGIPKSTSDTSIPPATPKPPQPSSVASDTPGLSSVGQKAASLGRGDRLQIYYKRLREAPAPRNAEEGLAQVRNLLDEVEDAHSGVPKADPPPPPGQSDGRMYPPRDDYTTRHPDGSITAKSVAHTIEIQPNGAIRITNRRTKTIEYERSPPGPAGVE